MFKMDINSYYNLTTRGSNLVGVVVKVLGAVNYNEVLKSGFDVQTLALNEKVLSSDAEEYLTSQVYFKLEDSTSKQIYYAWSDIIDPSKTNVVNTTTEYLLSLITLPNTVDNNTTIMNGLIQFAKSEYNVDIVPKIVAGDSNVEENLFAEKLAKAEDVLSKLTSLHAVANMITKVADSSIIGKFDDIYDEMSNLAEKVAIVAAGI